MGAMPVVELEVVSGCTYVSLLSYISIGQVDATGPWSLRRRDPPQFQEHLEGAGAALAEH